jgi:hypothetical protein
MRFRVLFGEPFGPSPSLELFSSFLLSALTRDGDADSGNRIIRRGELYRRSGAGEIAMEEAGS